MQPFTDAGPSIPVMFTSAQWGSLASFGARRYPGTIHSWLTLNPGFAASRQALADLDRFIGGLIDG